MNHHSIAIAALGAMFVGAAVTLLAPVAGWLLFVVL